MKVDYNYKSYILNHYQKLLDAERKSSMFSYSQYLFNEYGVMTYTLIHYRETWQDLQEYCKRTKLTKEFQEVCKINHAFFERETRLKKRISHIVLNSDNSMFLTLTFTDNILSSTSAETRRRYVSRYLKSFGVPYVANIDFGKNTEREHYHAVIGCLVPSSSWSYGFSKNKPIPRKDIDDITRLSKYTSKLTNHAIKETTHRYALLYSR